MKEITFRPLRRLKSGKIAVASYMGWRKVKTADYSKFHLTVNNEYERFRLDELVHNHKGEQLFFFKYHPDDIPVFQEYEEVDYGEMRIKFGGWCRQFENGEKIYSGRGMDVDGVPTFSHYTLKRLLETCGKPGYYNRTYFEPLTVETVRKWFGWFLWQLNNNTLKIGK